MADIDPPSFSLGLDLDLDPDLPFPIRKQQKQLSAPSSTPDFTAQRLPQDEDEDFGLQVTDSDPESEPNPPIVVLKRLRRGPVVDVSKRKKGSRENGDDEIEEFSSQEEQGFVGDGHLSTQHKSVCSSSKVPLRGCGVLTSQSEIRQKEKTNEYNLNAHASSSLEKGQSGLMFPKLTISPLRRFQLIDSDSDSDNKPSVSGDVSRPQKMDSSVEQQSNVTQQNRKLPSLEKQRNEDLWKDFCPMKSFNVPTPVLDEFCEEYLQSLKNNNAAQKRGSASDSIGSHKAATRDAGFEQSWNLADGLPPAHRYFFHDDPRIRKLVRTRLPNFFPLGSVDTRVNMQSTEPIIDYMSQFNGGSSKQKGIQRGSSGKGSSKRSKPKLSNTKVSNSSQGWVDPKSTATTPKDAGKRRVHANGQTAGHWYTSPDGRKVYVSRSGQEFSGQVAYRHYKKENGGFRKSKKKAGAKRKKG